MKKAKHIVENFALTVFGAFLRMLSEGAAISFARGLARLTYNVVGIRKSVTLRNLRKSFPAESNFELNEIALGTYRNLAITAVQFLRQALLTKEEILDRMEIKGAEPILNLVKKGKPAILVTAHLSNWELWGAAVVAKGIPITIIADRMHNPRADELVDSVRTAVGIKIIYTDEPPTRILKAMRAGAILVILIDQDAGESGAFVEYFGRLASTPKGPALFALKEKAPIFISFPTRKEDGSYEANFEKVAVDYKKGTSEENVREVTQTMTSMLEEHVRKYPDQWFWLHKRWKRRPPGEPESKKVLIVQTAFLGDVVLTTPLPKEIKRAFPEWDVHFVTTPLAANILENNPHVSKVFVFDKRGTERGIGGLINIAGKLEAESYDIAVIPHRSIRSAALVKLARIPERIGFDKSAGSFLFTDRVEYKRGNMHEVERNLSLLEPMGIECDRSVPETFPSDEDEIYVSKLLKEHSIGNGKPVVAIAPGSIWHTKRYPVDRYAELALRLEKKEGASVILLGSREDARLCDLVAEKGGISFAGQTTPLQSAALLKKCDLLVSNDSAPLHLAVSVGTPVVAIFGPTAREYGFFPYGENDSVIERELPCRPCKIHGGVKCPIGTFECMLDIPTTEVLKSVLKYLPKRAKK